MRLIRKPEEGIGHEDGLVFFPEECETLAVNRVEVGCGKSTQVAVHPDEEEVFVVVQGQGNAVLGGNRQPIVPGDVIYVPRHVTHAIACTGTVPLVYLCVANWPDKSPKAL